MWFDQDQSIDRPVISENRWQLKEKNWWRKLRLLKKYRLKWTQNERKTFSSKTINSYYMAVYYKQTWKTTRENCWKQLWHSLPHQNQQIIPQDISRKTCKVWIVVTTPRNVGSIKISTKYQKRNSKISKRPHFDFSNRLSSSSWSNRA